VAAWNTGALHAAGQVKQKSMSLKPRAHPQTVDPTPKPSTLNPQPPTLNYQHSSQVLMAVADDFAAPPAWDRGILERTPAFASAQLLIRDAISAPRVTVPYLPPRPLSRSLAPSLSRLID